MKEQLISFETAKLAKEKGFNIHTKYSYDNHEKIGEILPLLYDGVQYCPSIETPSAPTQSLLQKWIRELHNIHILIDMSIQRNYIPFLYNTTEEDFEDEEIKESDFYPTYEEALEAGLKEALLLL